jgi:hypothetical protein
MLILLSTGMPSNASFTYTATFDPKSSFASPFVGSTAGTPWIVTAVQEWPTFFFPASFQGITSLNVSSPSAMDNMVLSIVPEPASLALFLLGILHVLNRRRTKRGWARK